MNLDVQIEAVLFYRAAPMSVSALAKLFSVEEETVRASCLALQARLQSGGTRLIVTTSDVELVTAPETDALIEGLRRDEMKRDIGKAGAETLAIVMYRGPISRADIDRIRGVNSSFILRNLLVRGLVVREQTGKHNLFTITPELLAHLGLTQVSELPEYSTILDTLEAFEKAQASESA